MLQLLYPFLDDKAVNSTIKKIF